MGASSRSKGARGERECAAVFRAHGFPEADRGARLGKSGYDVMHVGDAHVEVKRVRERINIWAALAQAENDAPPFAIPVVAFRRNGSRHEPPQWYGALPLEELAALLRAKEELLRLEAEARARVAKWRCPKHGPITNPATLTGEEAACPICCTGEQLKPMEAA